MLVSRLNEEIGNVPDDIEPEILKLYEVWMNEKDFEISGSIFILIGSTNDIW
jgi:hypothetical protein